MDDQKQCECSYEKWVDQMAKFLKEQRHGANLVLFIHAGPGSLEAMYNNPDPVIAQGIIRNATLALDEQIKSSMALLVQTAKANHPEQLFNEKMKVN